jgi:hypothetical protein
MFSGRSEFRIFYRRNKMLFAVRVESMATGNAYNSSKFRRWVNLFRVGLKIGKNYNDLC